jgi:hypothetical protein
MTPSAMRARVARSGLLKAALSSPTHGGVEDGGGSGKTAASTGATRFSRITWSSISASRNRRNRSIHRCRAVTKHQRLACSQHAGSWPKRLQARITTSDAMSSASAEEPQRPGRRNEAAITHHVDCQQGAGEARLDLELGAWSLELGARDGGGPRWRSTHLPLPFVSWCILRARRYDTSRVAGRPVKASPGGCRFRFGQLNAASSRVFHMGAHRSDLR